MSDVLIIGQGYVGVELLTELALTDHNIHCVSRKDLDYHNQYKLYKFLISNNIEYVINCSGFTGRPNVDEAELRKEECWNLNVTVPLNISKSCTRLGVQYIHISSGCIFSGYDKQFTEEDKPNFGLFDNSSFYSKTKHAYELMSESGAILRVRMPFSNSLHERSYLTKIYKYDNLINYTNSKTYIPDLTAFIKYIVDKKVYANNIGRLNFVNPEPLDTQAVTNLMKDAKIVNDNWNFVEIEELNITAPRSNCVLSTEKLKHKFSDFNLHSESSAIMKALSKIQSK